MQKKDWFTIVIGALALLGTFITGLVGMESRVSKLEANLVQIEGAQNKLIEEVLGCNRMINRLRGELDGRRE